MKLTNLELINRINVLDQFNDTKFPQRISYAITRNLMILRYEYKCYSEELKKIMAKYADSMVKDKDGNIQCSENGVPVFNGPVPPEFNEDLTALLNIEIDVEEFFISPELFDYDDSRYDSLTGRDIALLQGVLCEG